MNELWRSSFGERRRPPGLPRPLGYDASRGVLLMEWIDGRPWLELGAWDARRLRDAVSLLADLHASNAAPIKNVLVAGDRVVLIDWDRFQGADPARDLGFLGSWFWVSLLRERRQPNWDALDWAVTTYERLRPGASLCHRLDFHAAAGLVRIAFSRLHLWPDEIGLVPAILNEAIRRVA